MIGIPQASLGLSDSSEYAWRLECPNLVRHRFHPQCSILQLDPRRTGADAVLFLPPVSGHGSALIQDLAKPMSISRDVHILDWADPAGLRKAEADYGHKKQVNLIRDAIKRLNANSKLHVVAICQAAAPTLLALDGLDTKNMTLTLLAAPLVDGPGGISHLFDPDNAEETLRAAEALITLSGNGSRILPGAIQLAAIMHGSGGAMRLLSSATTVEAMGISPARYLCAKARRLALLDARNIPARLLLENLKANFIERRHLVSLPNRNLPIHLVAGADDQVVPASQTMDFADHLTDHTVRHSLFSGLDHFDLFSSSTARREVSRKLMDFFKTANPSSRTVRR